MVRMPAELEVDPACLRLFEVIGLMVEEQGENRIRRHQRLQVLPRRIAPVVPPDDADTALPCGGIAEQPDARFGEKSRRRLGAGEVFVVAQAGVNRRSDLSEHLRIVPLAGGADGPVEDVSGEEHEVRLLGIDAVDPTGQFGPAVVVAGMQVAGQDDGQGLFQRLFRPDLDDFTVFVPVMEVAVDEQRGDESGHQAGPGRRILQQ